MPVPGNPFLQRWACVRSLVSLEQGTGKMSWVRVHFALGTWGRCACWPPVSFSVRAQRWQLGSGRVFGSLCSPSSARRTPEPHFPQVSTRQSTPSVVQKACLANAGQTWACVAVVWCAHRKNSSMLSGNINSTGNIPLSRFFFPSLERGSDSWFNKVRLSFCSVLISTSQRCVQAFQVTGVYVKLKTKIGFLGTQLSRYYIWLVMLNICP